MVGIRLLGPKRNSAGAGERDRLAVQEIGAAGGKGVVEQAAVGKRGIAQEAAAGELLVGHDAVEAVGVAVVEIPVAGGVEDAGLPLHPVLLVAEFDAASCALMCCGFCGRDRVEIVAPERLVEGVRDVDAPDVAVARKCRRSRRGSCAAAGSPTGAGRTRKPFLSIRKLGWS